MRTEHTQRRRYLVRNDIQIRFIVLLVAQMALLLAMLGIVVDQHMEQAQMVAASIPDAIGRDSSQLSAEIQTHVDNFYIRSLFLFISATLLVALFGLFASHKLAGPVAKLARYLDAVADGDFSQRIAFRRNDHLDDFADKLNHTIDALDQRRLRAREIGLQLVRRARHLDDDGRRDACIAELRADLAELRAVV